MTLSALKPVVNYLLPVAVLGAIAYGGITYDLLPSLDAFSPPCKTPVTYALGAYDSRFGVSRTEVEAALEEAAGLWNSAAGKTLVTFASGGAVPVNLVYGEHQEAVELGRVISDEQAAYDAKKAEVESLRGDYASAKVRYETLSASFERANAEYEAEVTYWNDRGGAPPGKYAELEQDRKGLERKQDAVNQQATEINALAKKLNGFVDELNELAKKTNSKVNVYNAAVGEDFDQGNYVSDKDGQRINIYEFEDVDELKRVLAHEFGHAIGLDHVENPESIMYSYDIGSGFALSAEDIAALKEFCRLK